MNPVTSTNPLATSLIRAAITDKEQRDGTWYYAWKQVATNFQTGADVYPFAPLNGTLEINPAVEINNNEIDVDTYVWLRQRGLGPGGMWWEFQMEVSSGGGPSTWKEPCLVATTTGGTLSSSYANGSTVDGVTLATGDRILIKNQGFGTGAGSENGIYVVNSSGAPTRASDANTADGLYGASVAVTKGTVHADTWWACYADKPITVGSTDLYWKCMTPVDSKFAEQPSQYDITTNNTWEATGLSITVPDSGYYMVYGRVSGIIEIASGLANGDTLQARLYNTTASGIVTRTYCYICSASVVNQRVAGLAPIGPVPQFLLGGHVIRLEAYRSTVGSPTWTLARIDTQNTTCIGLLRIA